MDQQFGSRRDMLIARVQAYFDACNESDREKFYSCFSDDVVHYFPPGVGGPYVGKKLSPICGSSRWRSTVLVGRSIGL
jgi:hypothetical protein